MTVVFPGEYHCDTMRYDKEQSQHQLTSTGTWTTLVFGGGGGWLARCVSYLFLQISHQLILLRLASEAEVIDLGLEAN